MLLRIRNLYMLCLTLPFIMTLYFWLNFDGEASVLSLDFIDLLGSVIYFPVFLYLFYNALTKTEAENRRLAYFSPNYMMLSAGVILFAGFIWSFSVGSTNVHEIISIFLGSIWALFFMASFIYVVGYYYILISLVICAGAKAFGLATKW
jgi:hypothetical protein